jgi:hypothetical protein
MNEEEKCFIPLALEVLQWDVSRQELDYCQGEAVNCLSPPCEEFKIKCARRHLDYFYFENASPEYSKSDFIRCFNGCSLESNQQVFKSDDKCVWWHLQYHHWWVGPCEKVGLNDGYAYGEEDVDCPTDVKTWRRGGSNEILQVAIVQLFPQEGGFASSPSSADEPDESSGTAGVNLITRNGQYKQICRPVYRNGRFRCSKTTK